MKKITTYIFAAVILSISGLSEAGQTEVEAAEAIATTITLYEKCTGDAPSPEKMERIVKTLLNAGMTPKDFERGSKNALSEIQRTYPGKARPSKVTCNKVENLYKEAFQAI